MSKINPDYLCPGCMAVLDEPDLPCPLCGFDKNTYAPSPRSLRPFTKLNGKYLVGKVIGEGGFGITYIGFNMETDLPVAIKEYFPSELATRDTTQGNTVTIFSGEAQSLYKEGLEKYLREARNLSMFSDLPGIVTVKDFFYENETAYIIMEYINGITLKQHLTKVGGRMKQNEVIKMMKPVLESMVKIHEVGIIHRDISPDNIMITRNKQIKLTDFGAARVFDTEDSKSITVVLKRGYAPEEQYRAKGNQGPWTDVYALCATMYRMITGVTPQEALERIIEDNVEPISKYDPNVWPETEFAIMKGLSLRAQDRFQTVEDLVNAIYYSVIETDADGNKHLVITKDNAGSESQDVSVAPTPVTPVADEFEASPIVVKIGDTPDANVATEASSTESSSPIKPVVEEATEVKAEETKEVDEISEIEKNIEIKLENRRTDILEFKTDEQKAQEKAEAEAKEKEAESAKSESSSSQPAPAHQTKEKKGGFFKSTFKKLVKLQLGKVRFEDNVTDLNVEHMDVGNISVLSGCYDLKKLVLNNNMVDDLSPLSNCEKLEYLALKNTLVSDLAPLAKCTNLKYLDLWGTRITDLHDIYSLSNLTYLCVKNTDIRASQIEDFKKNMPNCVVDS
ncbi:Serine/threonine protein kinase [Lachnospiraceae bacterium RM5]|nr:Serine/threonine protein kinase [Lachnospiraceae bacterium RM5]